MDYQAPTLSRKVEPKPRPKSAVLSSSASKTSFAETLSGLRQRAQNKDQPRPLSGHQQPNDGDSGRLSMEKKSSSQRRSKEQQRSEDAGERDAKAAKRGSRVMAAVAAFDGKSHHVEVSTGTDKQIPEPPLDPKAIETAFESLLVSSRVYTSDERTSC